MMTKLRNFTKKKETHGTHKSRQFFHDPVRKFHRSEPEGIVLYRDAEQIVEAFSYVIASMKHKYKDRAFPHDSTLAANPKPNIDHLTLLLTREIEPKINVRELLLRYQKVSNSSLILIHPGMILRLHGYVRGVPDSETLLLEYDEEWISITIIESKLHQELSFVINRFIFIIARIESVEKHLSLRALAVIL